MKKLNILLPSLSYVVLFAALILIKIGSVAVGTVDLIKLKTGAYTKKQNV